MSELVLRRDFADTRRSLLQRAAFPEAQNFPEQAATDADSVAPNPASNPSPGLALRSASQPDFSPGAVGRSASNLTIRQQASHRVQPVSNLWRSELLQNEDIPALASGRDVAGPVAISGDELLRPGGLERSPGDLPAPREAARPSVPALFAPLELALKRLLRTPAPAPANAPATQPSIGEAADAPNLSSKTGRIGPTQSAAAAVQRLEAGGWRFKRSRISSAAPAQRVQRALTGLATGNSRPIPDRPRTLLERVLQRDFAGVRVQMASLGPLGIEAAAQRNTVYLDGTQADLNRSDSLALLGHELTHVAAGGAAPLLAEDRIQRSPDGVDLPLAQPLAPSLTRRFSRQMVQMSLAEEEGVAEQVEAVVRRSARRQPTRAISTRGAIAPRRPAQRAASIASGSRSVAALAQRRLATSRFAPVSQSWPAQDFASAGGPVALLDDAGWRFSLGEQPSTASSATVQRAPAGGGPSDGMPLTQPRLATSYFASPSAGEPVTASATVDLLEDRGWRFKRSEGASASSARPVQRTAAIQRAATELHRGPSGGMPLPRRPRTLMERVLQRDFSGVRLQAAGLEPLGVEAAAHGQTVFMQRSALAQLDRPDNLALLGHELTHVAAGTNPPVRRSELNGQADAGSGSQAGVLPLSLPRISQLQRSLHHEESAANQVEQGIQTLLRQNAAVQREPLSPRPVNGPAGRATGGPVKAQTAGAGRTGGRQRGNGGSSGLGPPFLQRMPLPGQPISGLDQRSGDPDVQRAGQEGPVLDGVPTDAMPVVQRSPERQTGSLNGFLPAVPEAPRPILGAVRASTALAAVQRDWEESADDGYADNAVDADNEPDWDRLADKIYPLIKRMLQMERERRPL